MKQPHEVLGAKIVGGLQEASTPWAGASWLVELFRRSGVDAVANKVLPAQGSAKGLKQGQTVESLVLLSALGGECIEDMQHLRDDAGLSGILGYRPPAPEIAQQWLDKSHDEQLMVKQPLQGAFIPPESRPLVGLKGVKRRSIWAYVEGVPPGWEVTLDIDAQGNAPAFRDVSRLVDEAYETLPPGPWRVKVRSDSAAYQQEVLDRWDSRGWEFAVSADMSRHLREGIEGLAAESWHVWKEEKGEVIKEWAEVPYVPTRQYEKCASVQSLK